MELLRKLLTESAGKPEDITINQFCRRVDDLGWKSLVARAGGLGTLAEAREAVLANPGARLVRVQDVSAGGRVSGGAAKPSYDAMLPPQST